MNRARTSIAMGTPESLHAGPAGDALALATRIAAIPPDLNEKDRARLRLVAAGLLLLQEQGHTRVETGMLAGLDDFWDGAGMPWEEALQVLDHPGAACVVGCPGEHKPILRQAGWLQTQRLQASESRLAKAALARVPGSAVCVDIPETILNVPVILNPYQRKAVGMALSRPLTLVTGGPGTGKTAILVAILRAAMQTCPTISMTRVLLAAPTGKAAKRMEDAVRWTLLQVPCRDAMDQALLEQAPEATTLHRALGYLPGSERFRHDARNPIPADLILVDEASMVSQELMDALFRAAAPGARMVLLGDADQLPSVEPGAIFRELVAAFSACVVRLEESYRMDPRNPNGRHILLQAQRIQRGDIEACWQGENPITPCATPEVLGQGGVELLILGEDRGEVMSRFLQKWTRDLWGDEQVWRARVLSPLEHPDSGTPWSDEDVARILELLELHGSRRILCPLNEGPHLYRSAVKVLHDFDGTPTGKSAVLPVGAGTSVPGAPSVAHDPNLLSSIHASKLGLGGAAGINRFIHRQRLDLMRRDLEGMPAFLAGEPVMMLRNDPALDLFNGDEGVPLPVRRRNQDPHLEVFFRKGRGLTSHPLAAIQEDLELCYATTVHKAQGSEFDTVALVLPSGNPPLLTREILYTALTRARRSVQILGSMEQLALATARRHERQTGMRELLCALTP